MQIHYGDVSLCSEVMITWAIEMCLFLIFLADLLYDFRQVITLLPASQFLTMFILSCLCK